MARATRTSRISNMVRGIGLLRILLCVVAGLAAAWGALALALSGVARTKSPDLALWLVPNEATALATKAELLFFAAPTKPAPQVRTLARAALRSQAINPDALAVLGFLSEVKGDAVAAERLVRASDRLSRRQSAVQLWLIESSVRKGDVAQALVHYDRALRTKPDTQKLLFPVLAAAITNPEIRSALKPYVRSKTGWADQFLLYASSQAPDLRAVVDLVTETGGPVDPGNNMRQKQILLSSLVSKGAYDDARRVYRLMPGQKEARLISPAFDASDKDARFGAMGWQIFDDPDAGGSFENGEDRNRVRLSVFANAATTRPVATRLLYLAPGSYRLSVVLAAIEPGDGGYLRWQLRCMAGAAASAAPIWVQDSTANIDGAAITVPTTCAVQRLELIAAGGRGETGGQSGLEAVISDVSLRPAPAG